MKNFVFIETESAVSALLCCSRSPESSVLNNAILQKFSDRSPVAKQLPQPARFAAHFSKGRGIISKDVPVRWSTLPEIFPFRLASGGSLCRTFSFSKFAIHLLHEVAQLFYSTKDW